MKRVTIKDVAKEAGVAISTASNAMNGSDLVNEKTRIKIREVAERINYMPNLNGRYLKTGKTNMLGFISSNARGPYFYRMFEAMCRECERLGYVMNLIVTTDKNIIMHNLLGHGFDGFFLFEGNHIKTSDLEILEKNQVETILLDRCYSSKHIGSVVFNSYQSGYELTQYLINLGHKRMCFIEGADDVYDSEERKRGYKDALQAYNIEEDESLIIKGYFEERYTYNAVTSMLKYQKQPLPDAFIAGNDQSAIGCMKALKDLGYIVPDDVSVVGFDDIELAEYLSPSLTTVRNPIDRQGIMSVDLMVKMIQKEIEGSVVSLDGELIMRKSSGVVKKQ